MTDSLRWGILGTGGIADLFVTDLLANGFTVAAVGSRSQEGADAFAAQYADRPNVRNRARTDTDKEVG